MSCSRTQHRALSEIEFRRKNSLCIEQMKAMHFKNEIKFIYRSMKTYISIVELSMSLYLVLVPCLCLEHFTHF